MCILMKIKGRKGKRREKKIVKKKVQFQLRVLHVLRDYVIIIAIAGKEEDRRRRKKRMLRMQPRELDDKSKLGEGGAKRRRPGERGEKERRKRVRRKERKR